MKFFLTLTLSLLVLAQVSLRADEAGAKRVIAEYEVARANWVQKVNAAAGVEERRKLWAALPDSDVFGEKLFIQLDRSWDQDWFLKYAPKLLELAPAYSVKRLKSGRTPLSAIRESAERFHAQSPLIGPLCLALAIDKGPKTRIFIEKMEAAHPDKKVQGQAALALALLSRELGDGGNVRQFKKRRFDLIRKAIIEAAEMPFGDKTVGEVSSDLLYALSHLDKGMEAPDVLARTVESKAMRLSDFRGRPVMLVFWHDRMEASEDIKDFIREVKQRLGPRGLTVLGVASEDAPKLREMVKAGDVTWKNWLDPQGEIAKIYQVTSYPACWVLTKDGIVAFNGVPGPFAELTAEALLPPVRNP